MGIDEFVDLDIDEFQRRSNERLLGLVDRSRATIEADVGGEFEVVEHSGRLELRRNGRPIYIATSTAAGRLLLTDVSGRFNGRL